MERENSAATPQRYGALTALVTRYHSNALVERKACVGGIQHENNETQFHNGRIHKYPACSDSCSNRLCTKNHRDS